MRLHYVEYSNFWAVGSHPIRVQLDAHTATCIIGKNGSGKSTVLESICYALFGKLLSSVKLAQAINIKNKKKLMVSIAFEANGFNYVVKRGQKPNVFEIWKDDVLIDQSASVKEYQKLLESIINCDFKTFCQVVALNKERYVPFMDMKPLQRRQVVDEILDIGIFTAMDKICASRFANANLNLNCAKNDKTILDEKRLGQIHLIETLASNKETLLGQLDADESENKKAIADLETERDELIKTLEVINEELATVDIESSATMVEEINKITRESDFIIKQHAKDKTFFETNDVCPVCHQTIDDAFKQSKVSNIDELIAKEQELVEELKSDYKSAKAVIALGDEIKTLLREVQADLKRVDSSIAHYQHVITGVVKKKDEFNDSDIGKSIKDANEKLVAIDEEIANQELAIAECVENVKKFETIRTQTVDSGIKQRIIAEYLPIFNKKVNEYLYEMEFFIGLELNENFEESFNAVNRIGFSYDQLSTGQKCRVNLAIWLALLEIAAIKNSVSTNVLFLDEILESMDYEGVQMFLKLCRDKLSNMNIFVITQRPDVFKDLFDAVLGFKLCDDFTEIEYGL